ncbi:unnamed protein product [Owenia fusiformis]|uniref:Uncharacterized protein n=1 Tax=Owenia fusiformis TaxID=6347 RepID=A0A8S4Q7N5_OWEFU|nr:unnamed protein product [Owenia fusiformis]
MPKRDNKPGIKLPKKDSNRRITRFFLKQHASAVSETKNKEENNLESVDNVNKGQSNMASANPVAEKTNIAESSRNTLVKELLEALRPELNEIKTLQANLEGSFGELSTKMEEKIEKINNDFSDLKEKMEKRPELIGGMRELQIKNIEVNMSLRRNNVIIYDLPEERTEIPIKAAETELTKLCPVRVLNAYRIGRLEQQQIKTKARPLIVQLADAPTAEQIRSKAWVKKPPINSKIGEDLPEEARNIKSQAFKTYIKPAKEGQKKYRWAGLHLWIDGKKVNLDAIYTEALSKTRNRDEKQPRATLKDD